MTQVVATPVVITPEAAAPALKQESVSISPIQDKASRIDNAIKNGEKLTVANITSDQKPDATVSKESNSSEEKDPVTAKRLAELARRHRKDRAQQEQIKQMKKELDEKASKVTPILDLVAKLEKEPNSPNAAIELVDALGKLKGKAGAEFLEEVVDAILHSNKKEEKSPDSTIEEVVEAKLQERQKKQEEETILKQKAEEEAFVNEQFALQKDNIKKCVEVAPDKYELLRDEPDYVNQVFDAQLTIFQETGVLHPITELLDALEASLEERILKYSKISKKVASNETRSEKATGQQSETQGKKYSHTTLANVGESGYSTKSTSDPTLSKQERLRRVIAKAQTINFE